CLFAAFYGPKGAFGSAFYCSSKGAFGLVAAHEGAFGTAASMAC
ncbi:hypothetical protein Tco_0745603, partial [Tanacetum coccineum]